MTRRLRTFNLDSAIKKQEAIAKRYGGETTLYDDMAQKYHTEPGQGRPKKWFLWAYTPKGKQVALGPFASEDEVEQKIAEENLQNEVVRQYATVQLSKATQLLKEEITDQKGEDYRPIDEVIQRTMHQKSLDRMKK